MRRLLQLVWLVAGAGVLWLGGLAFFVISSMAIPAAPRDRTDAIVVVTGGRLRLESGLALLAAGDAKKLFISGVNPRVDRRELLRAMGPAAEREACCIALGHAADNTYGNARETAQWMREQGFASLRLVTSWYHMRRALLEFDRAMPQLRIVANPVFAHHMTPEHVWGWHGAAVLVIGEYHKYLAALLRPLFDGITPESDEAPTDLRAAAQGAEEGAPR
jgi:uncharacterized SAM-binding protein YcdF (DUF218 family)